MYNLCRENKGADQLRMIRCGMISCAVTVELICVFVFAYANSRFSHDMAQLQTDIRNYANMLMLVKDQKTNGPVNAHLISVPTISTKQVLPNLTLT